SEGGNVWLDPQRTTPYQFYQFWVNAADADAEKWIKTFTFLPQAEIDSLIAEHRQDPAKRVVQKRLAQEVTTFVHGEEEYQKAIETTQKLFAQQNASADTLSAEDLEGMQGIVKVQYPATTLHTGVNVVNLVTETGILPSKGEARKLIQNGGLSVNREKVTDVQLQVDSSHLLHGKYILLQKGKKNYYLIIAE
ncbi:MAG: tyrosine--tRNA ligase, partial [Bacteroidota bacterium]|nr:tyrosine--tRNA ligase [Bacteroidota bacterium]